MIDFFHSFEKFVGAVGKNVFSYFTNEQGKISKKNVKNSNLTWQQCEKEMKRKKNDDMRNVCEQRNKWISMWKWCEYWYCCCCCCCSFVFIFTVTWNAALPHKLSLCYICLDISTIQHAILLQLTFGCMCVCTMSEHWWSHTAGTISAHLFSV